MQFFIDNIFLIVMAIVSGGLLLWPSIRDRAGGERLDAVTATRLMNDEDPNLDRCSIASRVRRRPPAEGQKYSLGRPPQTCLRDQGEKTRAGG